MIGYLEICCGASWKSKGLVAAWWLPFGLCTMIVRAMFESMAVNRTRSEYALVFGRGVCCLHSCSLFLWTEWSGRSTTPDCMTIGNGRVEFLFFTDDIARLPSSSAGLQRALDRFTAEYTMASMQISTKKTEIMVPSRQKEQCDVSVNGTSLKQVEKFKYLWVEFSNDARQDCEIDRRIGSASAILRSLCRSVVAKKEVSRRARMAIFNAIWCVRRVSWEIQLNIDGVDIGDVGDTGDIGDVRRIRDIET